MSKDKTSIDLTPPPVLEFDENGFCVATGTKKIENNTERLINLPPLASSPDFPTGIKLWPGVTTVPNKYWRALEEYTADTAILCGDDTNLKVSFLEDIKTGKRRRSTRKTGKDLIDSLLATVKITKTDGVSFGPQITVYEPEQCNKEEGAPLPPTLESYSEKIAIKLIEHVNNAAALERWAKAETDPRRSAVKQAALTKLAQVKQ